MTQNAVFLGDGAIDEEEYEYVISQFNVSSTAAHKAYVLFSEVAHSSAIDFSKKFKIAERFRIINGRLTFQPFVISVPNTIFRAILQH